MAGGTTSASVPLQAEHEHERGDQDRAEREADVAADGEQAHSGAAPRAGGVVGVARALGWNAATPSPLTA